MLPNSKASNIETFDDTFLLLADDEIMDMIMHNTNNKIRETSRLKNNHPAFINSNKNPYVKENDHIEINGLFGLIYLRELIGMNLQMVDYLFDDEGHYAFGAITTSMGAVQFKP